MICLRMRAKKSLFQVYHNTITFDMYSIQILNKYGCLFMRMRIIYCIKKISTIKMVKLNS